jgi:hypothetical protein
MVNHLSSPRHAPENPLVSPELGGNWGRSIQASARVQPWLLETPFWTDLRAGCHHPMTFAVFPAWCPIAFPMATGAVVAARYGTPLPRIDLPIHLLSASARFPIAVAVRLRNTQRARFRSGLKVKAK